MPLPPSVRTVTEKKIADYCKNKIPEHIQNEIKISFKFRGNSVTIFENRPPWSKENKEWTSLSVAKMRYDEKTGKWTLYCADRNSRWFEYWDIEPTKDINKLLIGIDEDPTGIFWG